MTSFGDIILDSYIITFNLNRIMQLKQFYNIATKVSSRKKCYYFWWSTWLLRTDFRPKNYQTHGYSGVGRQGRMFLLCYSPEGHNLLLNTRNNSGLLATEIDKLHDRFQPSKTVVELVNFTCEWPNLQMDPPLVAGLRSSIGNNSVASYVIRHDRKSVASHSWNFHLMQTFAEPDR